MKKFIVSLAVLFPVVTSAATLRTANDVIKTLIDIGNTVIEILIAFAVLWIIWNIIMFIVHADAPEERSIKGKAIIWGIVGLAIIMSIWGLVALLRNSFQLDNTVPTDVPKIGAHTLPY